MINIPLIQCVPNFSEGRNKATIQAVVDAARAAPGVRLADWSADSDHNRLVLTLVGPPEPILDICRTLTALAVQRMDLTTHRGAHPRLGALDVLPLVPLVGITLGECAAWARTLGRELAQAHGLPVFLYEAASEAGLSLPFVRKEAFRSLEPDFGPPRPHPTAGACVVGTREPLIAFNVNLETGDVGVARAIARDVRGGGGGLVGVRALGLMLKSRGQAQVSMNVTRPGETSLAALVDYIDGRALALGTQISGTELIGALPGPSAFALIQDGLRGTLKPEQVLWENWPGATDRARAEGR